MVGMLLIIKFAKHFGGQHGPGPIGSGRHHILARSFSSTAEPTSDGVRLVGDDAESSSYPMEAPDDLRSRILRLRFPKRSATSVIEKWIAEGRKATAPELRHIVRDLKKSQRFKHALEISEWMRSHQESELSESDYAMLIDLITKVFGVQSAEEIFEALPPHAKSCEVYSALLHSYARAKLVEQAESLFERIKDSNLSCNILTFNEMMTLYTSVGQLNKVHIVVEELKRRKISPDLFTYNLRVSACAAVLDIDGVKKILDEMASDSNSDDPWSTYIKLTNIYIAAAHFPSSENSLVEGEKKISQREWITYDFLILLHAGLGNIQTVSQIWKALQLTSQKMSSRNYICVLSSYLLLGKLKEASDVIDEWKQSKVLDIDMSDTCSRLFDGFMKVGSIDTAETLREIMRQKNFSTA
ncbi:Pentatricopeptide repeat-containing protein [Platanthera zijinensis]|uniref:Pentatricopeptide repeat-containing protein n=1 Tax=Platanthera zijinensis TaxID=2320716 RepID=A0AAP0GD40_9ASPA